MCDGWGNITVKDIIRAARGRLVSGSPDRVIAGISTDSRKIRPGELFWALVGDTYDGHDFARPAMEKAAAGVVVEEGWARSEQGRKDLDSIQSHPAQGAVICVDDTLKALGDLAAWWRHQYPVQVVGITGSSGKTTTKEMTARILELGRRTLKNQGNFNNLIGLPLTLLELTRDHACAVLEMGMNHPGEIGRLTEIADPDIGMILNVGMAHLEGVSDLDGVARAKTEMMAKISPRGLMILNGDDIPLMRRASLFSRQKITFGLGKTNDVRASNIQDMGLEGIRFLLEYRGESWPVHVRVPGRHHLKNALAAAAAALSLDEAPENIMRGLAAFSGMRGRFQVTWLDAGGLLVDDTYNANPFSLAAAMESIGALVQKGGRIIVGFGDMLELGEAASEAHQEAGRKAASGGAWCVFAMGEYAGVVAAGARMAGLSRDRVGVVGTHEEMTRKIRERMSPGDVVLLKGSRRMQMEKVAKGLRGMGVTASPP